MQTQLRSVDLNLLVVLDAILEDHSLTGAAKRLNMSQPAVSNALSRLRTTFKDELFVRSRYGMQPTPRAIELIQPIKQALSIVQEAVERRNQFDPVNSIRTFHVAINDQSEERLLPRLLEQLESDTSTIKIESHPFLIDEINESLLTNRIDFSFDYIQPDDARIGYLQYSVDSLVVIACKHHPRLSGKISRKEFFDEKHVILKTRRGKKTIMESIVGEKLSARKVIAEVQNYNSLFKSVSKTEAIAVASSNSAAALEASLALQVLPLPFKVKKIPYYLLWSKARESDLGYLWFKNKIINLKSN